MKHMSNDHQVITNLKHAFHNRETVQIGGGSFTPNQIAEFLGHYRAMQNALEAARLLCANIGNGGVGMQTLADNFGILDDAI